MKCHGEMTRVERGAEKVWHCERCGAHALIDSTLRKLLPRDVWQVVWPEIRAAVVPGFRPCPVCTQRMEQTRELPKLDRIQLDYCDSCRLIWFDPEEIRKLPEPPRQEPMGISPELRAALRDRGYGVGERGGSDIGDLPWEWALLELALWALL